MVDKVIKLDPNFKDPGEVAGFFTWYRLEHILRAAGELREGEHIEGYVLENAGVNFYVKTS
jgi:hypothetical protein